MREGIYYRQGKQHYVKRIETFSTLRRHMENLLIIRFVLKISAFLNSHLKTKISDKFLNINFNIKFFFIYYLLTIIINIS